MYLDRAYSDDDVRKILATGIAPNATSEWPWLTTPAAGADALSPRRRGFRTVWGRITLETFESDISLAGYLAEDPFFDLGLLWGNGAAVGTNLSDLVCMHFVRIADLTISAAGWHWEEGDEAGRIFRVYATLRKSDDGQSRRLGRAIGSALLRAGIPELAEACSHTDYLAALRDFAELPTRPCPNQAG
ncbi:hypothetical protein SAMN05216345_111119 [Cupriavidus sp. YR651]|uniref:hypothetical protein n=1 Tax=Cupriavidus sp. YR651 TaxID=1855315 RepID=UPI000880E788|nr:hypothetical protein [Cupriavidus sp. YR651]SDD57876.1 hypothetical protein SAMN05216345_111119 [Cupriavidus sp. YR651]